MSKKLLRGVETVESGVKVTMVPGVIGEEERVEHDDHVSFVFYSFAKMAFYSYLLYQFTALCNEFEIASVSTLLRGCRRLAQPWLQV